MIAFLGIGIPLATFKPFLWFALLIAAIWVLKRGIDIVYKIRNP